MALGTSSAVADPPQAPQPRNIRAAMESPQSVVIVTCDGYEAWGRALDPVGAATDYFLVDAFTRFLEKRVVTQNMALLRRMMAEYFCHCETTVREFVAQGSAQISVGPFDVADLTETVAAQQLLRHPRSFARSGLSASVFTFLVTRLRTARASLLMQFFVEFCQGEDTALREFVEKHEDFVSIFPVAAPQLDNLRFAPSDGITFVSTDPLPMPPPPVVDATTPRNQAAKKESKSKIQPARKKRKTIENGKVHALPLHSGKGGKEGEADGDTSVIAKDTEHASDEGKAGVDLTTFTSSFTRPDEAMNSMKAKLVAAVREVEKNEPWTKVFPSDQPLPFNGTEHKDLARLLRDFWKRYARTAWERNFWAPLRPSIDHEDHSLRCSRQSNAVTAFERIALACFERFGPKFFYKLDRKRHPGWWYRDTCVDLLGLSAIIGYDKCFEYINAQYLLRFPDCGQPLPLRTANIGIVQRLREARVSTSLWMSARKPRIQTIQTKLVAYVEKRSKKKKEKRFAKRLAATRERPTEPVAVLAETLDASSIDEGNRYEEEEPDGDKKA